MSIMNNFPSSGAAVGYVIGTYTGNDATVRDGGQTIELGFRPQAVIVQRRGSPTSPERTAATLVVDNVPIYTDYSTAETDKLIEIINNGFTVYYTGSWRLVNEDNMLYMYIAFK